MNRDHQPRSACSKFVPGKTGTDAGHCTGFDRAALPTDRPCVLFVEQGTWADRQARQPSKVTQRRTTETA